MQPNPVAWKNGATPSTRAAAPKRDDGLLLHDVGHAGPVGQHHALREAAGPAGVGQQREVDGRVDRHGRRGVAVGQQLGERRGALDRLPEDDDLRAADELDRGAGGGQERRRREQEPGAGVADLGGDLVGRVERVDPGHDPAGGHRAVAAEQPFRSVGRQDREHVALAQTARGQPGGDPSDAERQLGVGERAPGGAVDHRRVACPRRCGTEQELRQRESGYPQVGPPAREHVLGNGQGRRWRNRSVVVIVSSLVVTPANRSGRSARMRAEPPGFARRQAGGCRCGGCDGGCRAGVRG